MKAVYLSAPHTMQLVEHPDPTPKQGEVVLKVVAAGICTNDLALFDGTASISTFPIIPGHECIGTIESVGAGVALEVGAWVTVYPSVGCGHCNACHAGRINHCPTFRVLGLNLNSGCFAEKMLVKANQVLPVPAGLRHPNAALIEPAAVAVHVNKRGETRAGSRVMVIGAGVIGLLTALVARSMGAQRVVLVDRLESRRALCAQLGFEEFLCVADQPEPAAIAGKFGEEFDVVYDTVCTRDTVNASMTALLPGSKLVLVATPKSKTTLEVDFQLLYKRELSLVVSRNYLPEDFKGAMTWLEIGEFPLDALITGNYPLERFSEAIKALQNPSHQHIKILLHP